MVDVYGNLNLKQNQTELMVIHKGSVFPSSPSPLAGQLFYRSDENKLYFYDDTAWTEIGAGAGGGLGRYTESFTSQTDITITHNLGDLNPVVQVYDDNNEQITPDLIDILNSNQVRLMFNVATTGFVVVHGGQGIDMGTTAYYKQAFTSETSVTVTHGLGQKYVQVQVFDDSDNLIEPQSVTLVDDNNLTVTFGTATSGYVVVAGGTTAADPVGKADFLPDTDNAYDIGSSSYRWKNAYFAGKLTVDGGIDPTYLQLEPQASDPTGSLNNCLWIDSNDNFLYFKDNAGNKLRVIHLDSTGKLPAVDGSQLTGIQASNLYIDSSTVDTNEYINDGGSNLWTIGNEITFTPPSSNNILLAIKCECDLKTDSLKAGVQITVSDGVNTWKNSYDICSSTLPAYLNTSSTTYETKSHTFLISRCINSANGSNAMAGASSYTIGYHVAPTGGNIAYMKNVKITLYYLDGAVVTTDSNKFT